MSYLAIDLGAESGRIIQGTLTDGKLTLVERHRFPTGGHHAPDNTYRWDITRIADEIHAGLRQVAADKTPVRSISADSWGVDYVWLDADGNLLAQPHHYRDARNAPAQLRTLEKISREKIFAETGLQFLPFNTLYQLEADLHNNTLPAAAARFLPIADYINYLLSGQAAAEETLASTTQLYNPVTRDWSQALIAAINFPARLLPKIVPPATILSKTLRQAAVTQTNLPPNTPVIATASHDTAAAIFAVPAKERLEIREQKSEIQTTPSSENCETADSGAKRPISTLPSPISNFAYLSSGTWSLLGAELEKPIINPDVLAANFTNEIGYNHTSRFLKNIIGMWLLQECRRTWAAEGTDHTYAQLQQLAETAEPLRTLINPNDPRFAAPGNMPSKIANYARETGQPVPRTHGETIRAALESLALLYNQTLAKIEQLTARKITDLHIVGGGSQNTLLNQLTANATNRRIHAGPVEATAIGNILLQALALGDIPDHAAARQIIRDSFPLVTHTPDSQTASAWQSARQKFQQLTARG